MYIKRVKRNLKKNGKPVFYLGIVVFGVIILVLICVIGGILYSNRKIELKDGFYEKLNVDSMLLTPNEYSRPGTALQKVNGVVIHYTANPGTDAKANRNYFESRKDQKEDKKYYVSSHYIIGLKGDIVQCVPLNEVAYASNNRNDDTISIECCHPKKNGKFTEETYHSLIQLTAWICAEYQLKEDDIIRHYDVTGKICPKYFVDHEEKWEQFKKDVIQCMKENKK